MRVGSGENIISSSSENSFPEISANSYARAISRYVPVCADEIALSKNDPVFVFHIFDDGWSIGRNLSSNQVGLLPGNHLVSAPDPLLHPENLSALETDSTMLTSFKIASFHENDSTESVLIHESETLPEPLLRSSSRTPASERLQTSPDNIKVNITTPPRITTRTLSLRPSLKLATPAVKVDTSLTEKDDWDYEQSENKFPTSTPKRIHPKDQPPSSSISAQKHPTIPIQKSNNSKGDGGLKHGKFSSNSSLPLIQDFRNSWEAPCSAIPQHDNSANPLLEKVLSANPLSPKHFAQDLALTPYHEMADTPYTQELLMNSAYTQLELPQVTAVSESSFSPSLSYFQTVAVPRNPETKEQNDENNLENAKQKLLLDFEVRSQRAPSSANIGNLKILVAGDCGIGKTSVIERFLKINETVKISSEVTNESLIEIQASTIWDEILTEGENPMNLKFVDTPGIGSHLNALETIQPVVQYHAKQFQETDKIFSYDTNPSHFDKVTKFLSGNNGAHNHVDIVLYGILHRIKPVDIEYMRQLSQYAALVPVILKCDTLSSTDIFKIKLNILDELATNNIQMYTFGLTLEMLRDLASHNILGAPPYAVAAARAKSQWDEFHHMKQNILFNHTGDIRRDNAMRFLKWREDIYREPQLPPSQQQPVVVVASSMPDVSKKRQIRGFLNKIIRSSSVSSHDKQSDLPSPTAYILTPAQFRKDDGGWVRGETIGSP
ncbi:hypothetical protein HK096_007545, partial [Nowakowskiella sp. JEL0078]